MVATKSSKNLISNCNTATFLACLHDVSDEIMLCTASDDVINLCSMCEQLFVFLLHYGLYII